MPLSKNQIKWIKSLHQKKIRQELQLFLVEGEHNLIELLQSNWQIHSLYCTVSFVEKYIDLIRTNKIPTYFVDILELQSISTLENNTTALAVVKMYENLPSSKIEIQRTLVLDHIQDPGNLGTILRICDWYGIGQLVCSNDCVELYNPKTISASKGAFLRVKVFYTDLPTFLAQYPSVPKYGAMLKGDSVHTFDFQAIAWVVMGNEAQGIRPEVQKLLTHQITIPKFGKAESLNVAMATAIICDNWQRYLTQATS
ncbi:MAG: RNA methyltransferase [Microscillaceae bacterium]|nr:RNA methyltransferase [Microscillaceae bacterium]MDW8460276.1 TrmH family RNA methyltransferase [Cytophagales bacterium]